MRVELLKKIMTEKMTTLPFLRNKKRKKVKAKTKTIKLVINIITDSISELNKLIYTGENLVCDEFGKSLKILKRKSNSGREFRLEGQVKKLRLAKMLRKGKTREYVDMER